NVSSSTANAYTLDLQSVTADLGSPVHTVQHATMQPSGKLYYLASAAAAGTFNIELKTDPEFLGEVTLDLLDASSLKTLPGDSSHTLAGPGQTFLSTIPVASGQ